MKTLLTRKEVAAVLGLSMDQVRRGESRLGLTHAKIRIGRRIIRYAKAAVEAARSRMNPKP